MLSDWPVIKSPHGQSLHFTKILDVYEEPDDETSVDSGTYDEAYWLKRSKETLETAKYLLDLTREVYANPELRFNKYSIAIASAGYIQLAVDRRGKKNVLVRFRYGGKRDEILELGWTGSRAVATAFITNLYFTTAISR